MHARTAVTALALITASALALTGCGRSDTGTGDSADGPTTIGDAAATGTLTMWAMGAEGENLPDFLAAFTDANPDVTVEVTPIPWDAAHNKFQTAIAGGSTPDLAMMGTTWMPDFADALGTVPTDLATDGFFPGSVETNQVGDRLAGVPWYVDTRVMYYRTDLAEQAGWTTAPTSWDELTQLATDLKTKAGTKYGIRLQPQGAGAFQGAMWMPWSAGAQLTDGSAWTLDTPEMVAGLDYFQSFYADGLSDPTITGASSDIATQFVSGDAPIVIEGPFLMGQLAEVGGPDFADKYATALVPADTASVSFSGGSNLVVFDGGDNQASAWKLVQWLSQPEQQAAWFELTGDLPAVQSTWDDAALSGNDKLAVFGDQLKTAVAPPAVTTWSQVSAAADTLMEQIAKQTITPAEALTKLQGQADSIGYGG